MKYYGIALSFLLAAFLVSACGATGPQTPPSRSADEPAIAGASAGFNAEDMAFANAMVASFRQTSELTSLVSGRSTDPDLLSLAAGIDAAQKTDRETVKVLLVQWSSNSDDSPGAPGGTVSGTVDDATVAKLTSSSGRQFDTLWLQSMIGHAQGAISVAEAEVADGVNVDAVATARRIAQSQRAAIDRMRLLDAG